MNLKEYSVSVAVVGFATCKVKAKDKVHAGQLALKAHYNDLEIEQYTLRADLVETVKEVKP